MSSVLLGVMEIGQAKDVQAKLKKQGIETVLNTNDETCTRGCSVTVELWGEEKDLDSLREFFSSEYMKNLEGHDVNPELLNQVFDSSAQEVICQACGFKFSPEKSECPDCGLCY